MHVLLGALLTIIGIGLCWAAGITTTICLVLVVVKLCGVAAVQHFTWFHLVGLPVGLWCLGLLCAFCGAVLASVD